MVALSMIALFVLMLVTSHLVLSWMARRAMTEVIHRFCRFNALDIHGARTREELGLTPATMVARTTRMRDYKPFAVEYLIKMRILRTTEDGKLYLVNQKLKPALRCPLNRNWKERV